MVTIDITMTLQTPLNIGSGAQRGTLADRAMIKDNRGWPYIPASTFKGRLRHAVEHVVSGLGVDICVTHQNMCPRDGHFCPVCRIFGSPWLAGKAHFSRLKLVGPDAVVRQLEQLPADMLPPTTQRYGVAISRIRGVAEDALLYTTELFEPGEHLRFGGRLAGELTVEEVGLILAGLRAVPALGRGKSGGLGWGTFETQVSGLGKHDLQNPANVRAVLAAWQQKEMRQ